MKYISCVLGAALMFGLGMAFSYALRRPDTEPYPDPSWRDAERVDSI